MPSNLLNELKIKQTQLMEQITKRSDTNISSDSKRSDGSDRIVNINSRIRISRYRIEWIVKSRIRVGSGGNSKKSDSGTQKVGYLVSYCALFMPNLMFWFKRSGLGRVGYIPDLEQLGSGSPIKVGFRSGTRKFWYPLHHHFGEKNQLFNGAN